jgi:tetratricopeptide (TPR) repeat protein
VKLPEIVYNTDTYFDNNLLEIPVNADEMSKAAEFLAAEYLKTENPECYGLAGTFHRILGNLEKAEQLLLSAIKSSEKSFNLRGSIRNKIRLAHVLQCLKRYEESDKIFEDVIESCMQNSELEALVDFPYQHYGKSLFDRNEHEEALKNFHSALELRNRKGNAELVNSTVLAIVAVEKRMDRG